MFGRIACLAGCLVLIVALAPPAASARTAPGPPLATPASVLAQVFSCTDELSGARRDPCSSSTGPSPTATSTGAGTT
jgi:hypothetical protein